MQETAFIYQRFDNFYVIKDVFFFFNLHDLKVLCELNANFYKKKREKPMNVSCFLKNAFVSICSFIERIDQICVQLYLEFESSLRIMNVQRTHSRRIWKCQASNMKICHIVMSVSTTSFIAAELRLIGKKHIPRNSFSIIQEYSSAFQQVIKFRSNGNYRIKSISNT